MRFDVITVINKQGGVEWLKNLCPTNLFNYLWARFLRPDVLIKLSMDLNSGWIIFLYPEENQVQAEGWFYEKGVLPVLYEGCLKKGQYLDWYVVGKLDDYQASDPVYNGRQGEFQKILSETKRKEGVER